MTRLYDCLIRFFKRATDMDLALYTLTTIRNFCVTNNHFQKQALEVYGSLENEILESFNNNSIVRDVLLFCCIKCKNRFFTVIS